jgi:hypothetical protein
MSSTATPRLHATPPATIVHSSCSTLSQTDYWSAWKLYKLKEFHRSPWVTLSQIQSCLISTFFMADSCPSFDVNPDRPSHQLQPGICQKCFSTLAHMSNQLSDRSQPDLSLCPVLTAHLAVITMSSIRNLGQDILGRARTPPQAPQQITISHTDRCRVPRILQTLCTSPSQRASRLSAD